VRYEPQHFQALATHQQHTATQSGLVLLVMFAWPNVDTLLKRKPTISKNHKIASELS
jgi:hypothetical protein